MVQILLMVVMIILQLLPERRYGAFARKLFTLILGVLIFFVFILLAAFVNPYWAFGSGAVILIGIFIQRKPIRTYLKCSAEAVKIRFYNWNRKRRMTHILAEVLTRGYSYSLHRIDPKEYYSNKRVPPDCFCYCVSDLVDGKTANETALTDDDGLTGFEAARIGKQPTRWVIYGPKMRLSRPGRYLVAFRVRCPYEGDEPQEQRLKFDVSYFPRLEKAGSEVKESEGAPKRYEGLMPYHECTVASGRYTTVCLEFEYRDEDKVEFRVEPIPMRDKWIKCDMQPEGPLAVKQSSPCVGRVVVDVVSVLRVGALRASRGPDSVPISPAPSEAHGAVASHGAAMAIFTGNWTLTYGPPGDRHDEAVSIDSSGNFTRLNRPRPEFKFRTLHYSPPERLLVLERVRLEDGRHYHNEVLEIVSEDLIQGHKEGKNDHLLRYVPDRSRR